MVEIMSIQGQYDDVVNTVFNAATIVNQLMKDEDDPDRHAQLKIAMTGLIAEGKSLSQYFAADVRAKTGAMRRYDFELSAWKPRDPKMSNATVDQLCEELDRRGATNAAIRDLAIRKGIKLELP